MIIISRLEELFVRLSNNINYACSIVHTCIWIYNKIAFHPSDVPPDGVLYGTISTDVSICSRHSAHGCALWNVLTQREAISCLWELRTVVIDVQHGDCSCVRCTVMGGE